MKISAKTRYALAALIRMAQLYQAKRFVTLASLADDLDLSKMYLEQVFALLKRGNIVSSVKGARGGYCLSRPPVEIKLEEVFAGLEAAWFTANEATVPARAPGIEAALASGVYAPLEEALSQVLAAVNLAQLSAEADRNQGREAYMYYL